MTELDIGIVNYHTPADLAVCLESLYEHWPTVATRLYLFNVDETPEEHEQARAHQAMFTTGRCSIMSANWNCGYATACNLLGDAMSAPYMAFFNADIIFTPGALDLMLLAMQKNPVWGIAGPRQVNEHGLIVAGGIFGTNKKPMMRGWNAKDRGEFSDVRDDCVSVSGSAIFFTRECWDELSKCDIYQNHVYSWIDQPSPEVQAFLPTPHYYEETFACYHARAHGFKLGYYGPARIIHKWHRASPIGGRADSEFMAKSRELFRAACDAHGIAHD